MVELVQIKQVFVSSTVYDLEYERCEVREILEGYNGPSGIRFRCVLSDHPDFPITPLDRATKHSYDMCIEAVAKCEYFVLLIKSRYGTPIIDHDGSKISITHREYREAHRRNIPRFVLVDSRTWDAKHQHDRGQPQSFVPPTQLGIFTLLDEIRRQTRGNWLDIYKSREGMRELISTFLLNFDDSAFVADVTIPHGTLIRTNERFTKTWEIRNNGLTPWRSRFLREENRVPNGLCPLTDLVPIPDTRPGQHVRISVEFVAPPDPSTCTSYWKMVDAEGAYCFPQKRGLDCTVKVI
jgi:hypothetical protein